MSQGIGLTLPEIHSAFDAEAVRAEFPIVDVTANEAVVKVELYRDGKHAFTDLLLLYRFPDGWKIVSKIFQSYS